MDREFLEDRGIRCTKAGRSLLLMALVTGKPHTHNQLRRLHDRIHTFGYRIGAIGGPLCGGGEPMMHFPELTDNEDVAYKFTTDQWYSHWMAGKLFCGPVSLYHNIENELARDPLEGYSAVTIHSSEHQVSMFGMGGFSSLVLCLSRTLDEVTRRKLCTNFGNRIIKINGLTEFSAKIQKAIGAEKVFISDVTYTDLKAAIIEDSVASEICSYLDMQQSEEPISAVDFFFDRLLSFYDISSIFIKPLAFRDEMERRISFQMSCDQIVGRAFSPPDLRDHLELIE